MDDRANPRKILIPGLLIAGLLFGGFAVILLLGARPEIAELSDGTHPGADDPALKDLGDGLKYRDLKVGEGDEVKPGSKVTVHYTGWLVNGTMFDSSRGRGQPSSFSLNSVVEGWKRGIPGMKPGGVRKLVIPPALGYGNTPTGKIPANSTLVFEVELISPQ